VQSYCFAEVDHFLTVGVDRLLCGTFRFPLRVQETLQAQVWLFSSTGTLISNNPLKFFMINNMICCTISMSHLVDHFLELIIEHQDNGRSK